ncbi:MAG TPA: hypothetical protein VGO53_13195 [Steroidobacteraceae bacterium]|nr:hypothetical protein [Steroidobacteraceae bacterium]
MLNAALLAVALLSLTMLGGCGGTGRLAPETPGGVNLAGTWKLNRAASDDPQAMIAKIQRDLMKRLRRGPRDEIDDALSTENDPGENGGPPSSSRGRRGGGQQGAAGGTQAGAGGGGRREYMPHSIYAEALGAMLTNDALTIEQSPTRFALNRGGSRRSFTPGGESVVSVPEGVADQHSGWKGREYVIEVKPQVGARVIERYGLSPDNRQLVEKVTATEEGLPKLEFTRVYEPGAPTQRPLPTSN